MAHENHTDHVSTLNVRRPGKAAGFKKGAILCDAAKSSRKIWNRSCNGLGGVASRRRMNRSGWCKSDPGQNEPGTIFGGQPGIELQNRHGKTGKMDPPVRLGQAWRSLAVQLHNQPNHRRRCLGHGHDADAAHLDEAPNSGMALCQQAPVAGPEMNAIIPDERRMAAALGHELHQPQGKARFAAAGNAGDEHATLPQDNASAMQASAMQASPPLRGHGVSTGRETTNRAPATDPSALCRFSARMLPRCASTICCEIESPSPEFWPKPWLGRSV